MTKTRAPFLQRVETRPERVDPAQFPFTIRAFAQGIDLDLVSPVAFFVGENGSGKSTLLEALVFLRAESFYNFATHIEGVSDLQGSSSWTSPKRRYRLSDSSRS